MPAEINASKSSIRPTAMKSFGFRDGTLSTRPRHSAEHRRAPARSMQMHGPGIVPPPEVPVRQEVSLASNPENRLSVRLFFTAMARALRCPIRTTNCFPRVMPV